MDKVAVGAIEMTWSPATRVATLRFTGDTLATRKEAEVLVEAMRRWVGDERRPFGLLGDGGRLSGLDAGYRATWGAFYKQHREDGHLAFFNMGPMVRVAAEMFRIGTGTKLKAFRSEEEARAWLREMGIPA